MCASHLPLPPPPPLPSPPTQRAVHVGNSAGSSGEARRRTMAAGGSTNWKNRPGEYGAAEGRITAMSAARGQESG